MTAPPAESADLPEPPVRARRSAPLDRRERVWVAVAAVGPAAVAVAVLAPLAVVTSLTGADVVGAALVYGGLLGLAGAFVATDRLQARQCPRCRTRRPRGEEVCGACAYDLVDRPRYTCDERHLAYVDDDGDGRCECGRRLHRLPPSRGVGPQVVGMLRIGAGLLLFLIAIGVVLRVLEGRV